MASGTINASGSADVTLAAYERLRIYDAGGLVGTLSLRNTAGTFDVIAGLDQWTTGEARGWSGPATFRISVTAGAARYISDGALSASGAFDGLARSRVLAAALGDSIAASLHLDIGAYRNLNARCPLNWANAMSGGRLKIVPGSNFGVSGERTDQIMARVQDVIASGAGLVWLVAGTNDIAQLYPSAATCAATAAANVTTMVQRLNAAGIVVICEMVPGAADFSATQLGYMNELNQRLIEFAATGPADMLYLHDASRMVLNPTNSTSVIAGKANYFYDATHPAPLGAYYWGKSLATLIQRIVPQYPRLGHLNLVDAQRSPYLLNPFFATQSGGTNTIGAALTGGAVPANWVLARTGSPTVAISYGTDDGTALDPSMGNKVILTCTFTAAGQRITLQQDVGAGLWTPGVILDTGARHRVVSGGANVASARHQLSHSVDGSAVNYYSMIEAVSTEYGPDETYTVDHVLGPVVTQSGTTKNYLTHLNSVVARAAGTAVVEISRPVLRPRLAA